MLLSFWQLRHSLEKMEISTSGLFPRLLLIVAFLAAQWSAVHIHLEQDHHHGGEAHSHELKIHPSHAAPGLAKLELDIEVGDITHHRGEPDILYVDPHFNARSTRAGEAQTPTLAISPFRDLLDPEFQPSVAIPRNHPDPLRLIPEARPHPRAPPTAVFS